MKLEMKKGTIKLAAILFLVLILWLVIAFVIGAIKNTFVSTAKIKYGELQDTVTAIGYFVKTETVILAPQSGQLKKLVDEGERVRIKSAIAEVLAPSIETASGQAKFSIKSPRAGLVSYRLDGLEQVFTPEGFEKLNPQKVIETFENEENGVEVEPEKGKPLLKIIENLKPVFLYIQITKEGPEFFIEGERVLLNLSNPSTEQFDIEVEGLIRKVKNSNGYDQVLIESKDFEQFLLGSRKINLQIVKNSYEGYIVPKDSLVQKEGKTGLFIVYKEAVKWVEVELLGQVAHEVVVKSSKSDDSLNVNTVFIVKPSLVDEGESLN